LWKQISTLSINNIFYQFTESGILTLFFRLVLKFVYRSELIEGENQDVNAKDATNNTPLHWAAGAGHLEAVQYLLSRPDIKLNEQNLLGDTPLHRVVIYVLLSNLSIMRKCVCVCVCVFNACMWSQTPKIEPK
jgi:ankyrin repeat protein